MSSLPEPDSSPAQSTADQPAAAPPLTEQEAAEDAAALVELAALQDSSYRRLGPVLGICVAACQLLWQIAAKQPVVLELRRRTGLNPRALATLKAVETPEAFANLWTDQLPDYYYALLVGRLILESPMRPMLLALLKADPNEEPQLDKLLTSVTDMVRATSPMTERWLVGQFSAGPNDPLPDDPAARAALAGWVVRRSELEAYFGSVAPEFARVNALNLHHMRQVAAATIGGVAASAVPERRGPFLRRTFTDDELAALRLLLTYVPSLTRLLPGQPFARVMHSLSALQPPARVEELLGRLRAIKAGQALHFTLGDCLTLLQTLQSGALLLLRASSGDLIRALRRHADDPHDPDEDLRIERGRLLFLLSDEATRTRFRAVFGSLLKTFSAAVDRTFPHAPELTQARAELADLAAVR